jgi:hypothetical protein
MLPWPTKVICDHGSDFMAETKDLLKSKFGIRQQAILTQNAQANSMVEHAHQTLHQLIRSQIIANNLDIDLGDPLTAILTPCAFIYCQSVCLLTLLKSHSKEGIGDSILKRMK